MVMASAGRRIAGAKGRKMGKGGKPPRMNRGVSEAAEALLGMGFGETMDDDDTLVCPVMLIATTAYPLLISMCTWWACPSFLYFHIWKCSAPQQTGNGSAQQLQLDDAMSGTSGDDKARQRGKVKLRSWSVSFCHKHSQPGRHCRIRCVHAWLCGSTLPIVTSGWHVRVCQCEGIEGDVKLDLQGHFAQSDVL